MAAKSSPGLEGVVVGETKITHVGGEEGTLHFRGYDASELSEQISYEEVVHLLQKGELPTVSELQELKAAWYPLRPLPPELEQLVGKIPKGSLPMEALRSGISLMGAGLKAFPPRDLDMLPFIARAPTWLAMWYRASRGLPSVPPDTTLGHVSSYLYMLEGRLPDPDLARALEEYFVLLSDHGMNASTFAARVVLSTQSDPASAMSAAVGALKGPLHGGAPSLVLDMLDAVGVPGNAERWIAEAVARKERLMGFGHRVYRTEDPRAKRLKQIAQRYARAERFTLAEAVEKAGLEALRKARPNQPLYTNVEFYAGVVLEAVGIPRELFSATFGIARTAGWAAQLLEQAGNNRIIRPDASYTGPEPRPVPIRSVAPPAAAVPRSA
ncbi:MAG: citrate/2-methylcitrate synthase [Euryarchaeota archaeon]|nr:citrate/2-methylcitrate synthase [Euryarchaeota archaeon]MDE2045800.1 citrate/2-methylcitrate synthase [Thermoplasmata archaeon]